MTLARLREEIESELGQIDLTVRELHSLYEDVADREPTIREKTAAAAFLAQFYNGVENILKRISYFNSIPLPVGDAWHIDLFKRFCNPPYGTLPVLFDESSVLPMSGYRKFRHVVHHGYGFQLDWSRLKEGMDKAKEVASRFEASVRDYLTRMEQGR